jgi:hypothetical protein
MPQSLRNGDRKMPVARHWFLAFSACIFPLKSAFPVAAIADHSTAPPHYELVMSVDDAVCKPIAGLYDTQLQMFAHHLPATGPRTTDFEATHAESFARLGFMPIASTDTPADPDLIVKQYSLDLFNEGKARIVIVTDKIGDNYRSSELHILKPGAQYRRVAVLNESQPGIIDWYIDPATIADIPHRPMMDGIVSIRPFTFQGNVYFIQNQYARLPVEKSRNSIVVVDRLLESGRDDICYIVLNPGN